MHLTSPVSRRHKGLNDFKKGQSLDQTLQKRGTDEQEADGSAQVSELKEL